jgi:bifunctional DNase/RNase
LLRHRLTGIDGLSVTRCLRAVGAVVACVVVLRGQARLSGQAPALDDLVTVELSTVGFDPVAGAPIVLLREPRSGRVVPIWIGATEAQAIAMALHGITVPRPMTHDLMASLVHELGASVEEVVVHDLRDNTYHATVRVRVPHEGALRDIDSRPSDALALALRTGASIRVSPGILKAAPRFDFAAPERSGQVVHALGITVVAVLPALRDEFRLPDRSGVVVTHAAGRAAEGLQRGDLIVEVDGQPVGEPMDFFKAIRVGVPGRPIRIRYWRADEEHEFVMPADEPPPGPSHLT